MKHYFYNQHILLSKWLQYIQFICSKNMRNNISRVVYIAKKLKILNISSFIITVSGTNGKGSTCALLEKILLDSGYTVGKYSSPHLFNYYERIKINGSYIINPLIHISIFKKILSVCKDIKFSYFEFITLAALLIFQSSNLDVIILEVGLGGRLDATNVIIPHLAIVTNIGLDHIHELGDSRYLIGYEKSGIFRKNVIVCIGENNIPYSVYQVANFSNVSLYRIQYEWNYFQSNNNWYFYDQNGIVKNLPIPKISLSSAAITIAALRVLKLNIKKKNIIQSLKKVFLPGRFHIIHRYPLIILDAAHNAHATYYLYQQLKNFLNQKKNIKIYGLFGILSRKDIKNTVLNLKELIHCWYYTSLQTYDSATEYILKEILPNSALFYPSVQNAIYQLMQRVQKKDLILVFGSFVSVAEAITSIRSIYFQL